MVKKFFFIFSLFSFCLHAEEKLQACSYQSGKYESLFWFTKFGSGYAYSCNSRIYNSDPFVWDQAFEGYDESLGGAPYFKTSIGGLFFDCFEVDLSYAFFQNFHYIKHQTGVSQSLGYTSYSRMRFFDLSHQNIMLTGTFCPADRLYFSCKTLDFTFYAGYAIGTGFFRAYNFYTDSFSNNVGSVTSIGDKKTSIAFAWQALAGVRIHPKDSCCSIDLGYSYYNGGTFILPSKITANDTSLLGLEVEAKSLRGRLKSNLLTITVSCFF